MVGQTELFPQQEKHTQEIWVCQSSIKVGRKVLHANDRVVVISRQKDHFNLDTVHLLHPDSSAYIETLESFFIKHFYLLTKKGYYAK